MDRNAHHWTKPLTVAAGIALLAIATLGMVAVTTGADRASTAVATSTKTTTAFVTLTPRPVPTRTVTRYVEVEAAPVTTTATTRVTVTVRPKPSKKASPAKVTPTPALRTNDRIEEDDPRFNCKIHGNKGCGPATHNGAKRTQSFEDGSATYADGYRWDPDTRTFERN